MNSVFVDTSGWANAFDRRQPQHAVAVSAFQQMRQNRDTIITSNYVIAELVALLQRPLRIPRSQIFTTIDTIKTTSYLNIIHIDAATDTAAWNLCKSRPDKAWSLVDCTSFVLMQQQGIQVALTTDHHFEQAGFIRLLNPSKS
ncbi:VapC toxin family PIN domain ribonuclease [filamentous cyanobacterium CCT1]|nr:VapC toxin family PIN domain ribonuclease [filamentous cyanobacterium CCT1]PSN79173.1 VapC toxin family PIN domain ribonuclease [filamentous cyanobacterium CCP4]